MTYHFVYKTTNQINNRFYIGKHSTTNMEDGYLGSGLALRSAISKYGVENFKREILMEFATEEEAYKYESALVTEELIADPLSYNIVQGGKGYLSGERHTRYGTHLTEEQKQHLSRINMGGESSYVW